MRFNTALKRLSKVLALKANFLDLFVFFSNAFSFSYLFFLKKRSEFYRTRSYQLNRKMTLVVTGIKVLQPAI
jgi:hypothetical protein